VYRIPGYEGAAVTMLASASCHRARIAVPPKPAPRGGFAGPSSISK
jgi:hypothetical protein